MEWNGSSQLNATASYIDLLLGEPVTILHSSAIQI